MTVHNKLAAEAEAFKASRKLLRGPEDRDAFVVEPDPDNLGFWRIRLHPVKQPMQIIPALSYAEANRQRLELSDRGFIGKVAGDVG